MKREFGYILIGVAVLSMLVWFILPVFSFVLVVPLYNITGMTLANRINQLMFIPLVLGAVMVVGAVLRNKPVMIAAAAIQLLVAVLTMAFKKECIVEGNGKFIIDTASLLINSLKDQIQQWTGTTITAESIREIINVLANYMQPGLGWVLHAILTAAYLLIACLAPAEKKVARESYASGVKTDYTTPAVKQDPSYTPVSNNNNNGYKHRT